jgi:hypothetical protein
MGVKVIRDEELRRWGRNNFMKTSRLALAK